MTNDMVKMRKEIMEVLNGLDCRKCTSRCFEGGFKECTEEVADKIMKLITSVD